MNIFQFPNRSSSAQAAIAIFVALFFFSLLAFAGALEVHHVFSEIDHDGHEHSDFDLCQWVQAHGSGSIDFDHVDIDITCLLYTSPSPRDLSTSRMPASA